mmetsp:Transcript_150798/g.281325  ORF Transcript_150798/g.281325 Transcript_150798/m.281325 type:complete len:211 (-) Transcript_150798:287-919(-)
MLSLRCCGGCCWRCCCCWGGRRSRRCSRGRRRRSCGHGRCSLCKRRLGTFASSLSPFFSRWWWGLVLQLHPDCRGEDQQHRHREYEHDLPSWRRRERLLVWDVTRRRRGVGHGHVDHGDIVGGRSVHDCRGFWRRSLRRRRCWRPRLRWHSRLCWHSRLRWHSSRPYRGCRLSWLSWLSWLRGCRKLPSLDLKQPPHKWAGQRWHILVAV